MKTRLLFVLFVFSFFFLGLFLVANHQKHSSLVVFAQWPPQLDGAWDSPPPQDGGTQDGGDDGSTPPLFSGDPPACDTASPPCTIDPLPDGSKLVTYSDGHQEIYTGCATNCDGGGGGGNVGSGPPVGCSDPSTNYVGTCSASCGGGQILAYNTCGYWLEPCNTQACACSKPAAPSGLSPSGSTAPGLKTLSWNPVSGATSYAIRINDLSTPWCHDPVADPTASECYNPAYPNCTKFQGDYCLDNLATNSYSYTLSPGKKYDFWVAAINSCGWGPSTGATLCATANPEAPVLLLPQNNAVLGNTSVTTTWNAIANWGESCLTNVNEYKVYLDENPNPTTLRCTVSENSAKTCTISLLDQTKYYWKVVAANGATSTSSEIRNFTIRQPKICGGTLFDDQNQSGCYDTNENPVSTSTITVTANSTNCTTNSDKTYCCVIPGTNDGTTTSVGLSVANFNPPYSGRTNCSEGTTPSCSLNNCTTLLGAGDVKVINIGFGAKSWFQTNSCPVYSNSDIVSEIPASPQDFDTGALVEKYFVLNSAGPVLSGSQTAMNFGTSGGLASLYRWSDINYQTSTAFNYDYFQKKLDARSTKIGSGGNLTLSAGKLSDGVTNWNITNNSVWEINGSLTVSSDASLGSLSSAILASGDITFGADFDPANSYFAFVSKTGISALPAVKKIHAILFTDGMFADGTASEGLKIIGSVIALNGFNLQRSQGTSSGKPAEYFVCDPAMFVKMTSLLGVSTYRWEESAP